MGEGGQLVVTLRAYRMGNFCRSEVNWEDGFDEETKMKTWIALEATILRAIDQGRPEFLLAALRLVNSRPEMMPIPKADE